MPRSLYPVILAWAMFVCLLTGCCSSPCDPKLGIGEQPAVAVSGSAAMQRALYRAEQSVVRIILPREDVGGTAVHIGNGQFLSSRHVTQEGSEVLLLWSQHEGETPQIRYRGHLRSIRAGTTQFNTGEKRSGDWDLFALDPPAYMLPESAPLAAFLPTDGEELALIGYWRLTPYEPTRRHVTACWAAPLEEPGVLRLIAPSKFPYLGASGGPCFIWNPAGSRWEVLGVYQGAEVLWSTSAQDDGVRLIETQHYLTIPPNDSFN